MKCRHCAAPVTMPFIDLGHQPPSNAYLQVADLSRPEVTYPLRVLVCGSCRLVQTEDYAEADALFTGDYAYFSSTSKSWLAHAARYAEAMTTRYGLGKDSLVVEVASNDGYLLRNFVQAGIPCLGIEPTAGTAAAARTLGIETIEAFFGEVMGLELAEKGCAADLIVANNVFAHVPDINDFAQGLAAALKPDGVITLEFPHLMRLVEFSQFDTIYHEHFSYLSLLSASRILEAAGLRVFDVEELPTHGGSLRLHACHRAAVHAESPAVSALRDEEKRRGMCEDAFYAGFQARADGIKNALLTFLLAEKAAGRSVAGYGAAAKGNTLLNHAGVKRDLLPFVCDAAPSKQGRYLPGSHIPILAPEILFDDPPDHVLILPWNIATEVRADLSALAARGTKFVTAVPELVIT